MSKYGFCTLLVAFGISIAANAQNTCTQSLRSARTAYDEGQLQRIPALLESCLASRTGFSDEEKTEAYRLLILAHIFMDEPAQADEAMLSLLRFNPEFQVNESADPAELINLYGTFRTKPIFLFGGKFDFNYSLVEVLNFYGLHDQNSTQGDYESNVSFGGSLIAEKEFNDKISARVEPSFVTHRFTYTNLFLSDVDGNAIAEPEAIERQSWLALKLRGQYKLLENSFNPTVSLGVSGQYLLLSDLDASTLISGGEPAQGPTIDLSGADKDMRQTLRYVVHAGIGVKRKIGRNYFTAELDYAFGLNNITKSNYDNELSWRYGLALNDIRVHTLTFSVGVLLPKYNPKKLTK